MKKIIICLIATAISFTAKSQAAGDTAAYPSFRDLVPNSYFADPLLQNYEGLWMWTSGTDTVRIFLKKEAILFKTVKNCTYEELIGFHEYKQGSQVVESSMQHINTSFLDNKSTILVGGRTLITNTVNGTIRDLSKNKTLELKLLPNASFTQLHWKTNTLEGVNLSTPQRPFYVGITLPSDIILIKQ